MSSAAEGPSIEMDIAQQQTVTAANLEPRMNCEALIGRSVLLSVRFVCSVATPSGASLTHRPHEARCGIQADSNAKSRRVPSCFPSSGVPDRRWVFVPPDFSRGENWGVGVYS